MIGYLTCDDSDYSGVVHVITVHGENAYRTLCGGVTGLREDFEIEVLPITCPSCLQALGEKDDD